VARWLTARSQDAHLHEVDEVRSLITAIAACGNRRWAGKLAEAFRLLALPRVVEDEVLQTPRSLPDGPVTAGHACFGGERVGLPGSKHLGGHLAVVGITNSGKTTLCKELTIQWMLES
jgi:hypothetical protein